MNTKWKKSLALILSLMIMACCCVPLCVNAEDSKESSASEEEVAEYVDDGHMNLDIVFVIDASGSMLYSDPDGIALDAMNLFLDLCDDSCGVGYDVYTQKIMEHENITAVKDTDKFNKLKNKIGKIKYDPVGDTDIALGLTKAMKNFEENKNSDTNRKKAIVLLSDGNTDLPNGPRTVAESKKEMETTLAALSEKKIPVYAIGLNSNGSLDKKEIDNIAKKTGGRSYETKTSDKLTWITSDIFSDIYELEGVDREIKDGNVEIPIKDNSVFYVNIIIRTKLTKEELSPILTAPNGKTVSLTGKDNVKMTSTGSYTLIKLVYPDSGTWNLHLRKANNDNCSVKQLDFYSVYIKQKIDQKAVIGDSVKIEATLNDGKGIVNDSDLLRTIEMTSVVSHSSGEQEVKLTRNSDGTFTGEFVAENAGEYSIKTRAESDKFKKVSSTQTVSVFLRTQDNPELSEVDDTDEEGGRIQSFIIVVGIVIGLIVLTIIVLVIVGIIRTKADEAALQRAQRIEETKPKQNQKPIPTVKAGPKATDPDYVDVTIIEHDALENLIKKGTDDAFSTKNADQYQADASLEALIKKGADDPFQTNSVDYTVDPSLAALIKTGGDGLEGVGKEEETYDDDEYDDDEYDDDDYDDDDYEDDYQ